MSEKNQIVVVLIVALFLGPLVDWSTALKIAAGVVLLWSLQNQPTVFECIRKLFSFPTETAFGSGVPRRRNDFQGLLG